MNESQPRKNGHKPHSLVKRMLWVGVAFIAVGCAILLVAFLPRFYPNFRSSSLTDWLLVLLTLSYVTVTALQLNALHRQLVEMQRSHRPWVNLTMEVTQPIAFNAEGAMVGIRITVKNGGDAPAIRVVPIQQLVVGIALGDTLEEQDKLCNEGNLEWWLRMNVMPPAQPSSALLLPGEERQIGPFTISAERSRFRSSSPRILHSVGKPSLFAWVTGCLVYSDDAGKPHATSFNFQYVPDTLWFQDTDMGTYPGRLQSDGPGRAT